eukprot:scaffold6470_cov124-Isochrysis_galbana.AAC.2
MSCLTGPMYLASAAVFMAEVLKLPYCVLMVARVGGGLRGLVALVRSEITGQVLETFKCAVPALAYTIQGNLLFVALSNLDAPTYQVTYQTKTLFTALFSRLMLGRTLARSQWLALALLFLGAVLVSDLCVPVLRVRGRAAGGLSAAGCCLKGVNGVAIGEEDSLRPRSVHGGGSTPCLPPPNPS